MIYDITVYLYLHLIQRRDPDAIKVTDFNTMIRIRGRHFSSVDRVFRNRDIFSYKWILLPYWKESHFTLTLMVTTTYYTMTRYIRTAYRRYTLYENIYNMRLERHNDRNMNRGKSTCMPLPPWTDNVIPSAAESMWQ